MKAEDGKKLAEIPKRGDPSDLWLQDRPNTYTNAFGVVDHKGATIPGLHVEIIVTSTPRLKQEKFVLGLYQETMGKIERAY